MLTHNITNWVETTEETEMATRPGEFPPKARQDGPEEPPSGTQDLSYRKELKEKQEDQPRDGLTT